ADGTCFKQAVAHDHVVIFFQALREIVDESPDQRLPACRQVLGDAADTEPVWMHTTSAYALDDIKYPFPVGKHIEHRRKLSEVLREGAVPHQVAGDAEQLAHHDTDVLRTFGHFNAGEFFYRE